MSERTVASETELPQPTVPYQRSNKRRNAIFLSGEKQLDLISRIQQTQVNTLSENESQKETH